MRRSNHSAVRIDAPSPLVGEGITAGRHELTPVRGHLSTPANAERTPHPSSASAKPILSAQTRSIEAKDRPQSHNGSR